MPRAVRLPIEPLRDAMAVVGCESVRGLARRVGVSGRGFCEPLTLNVADRCAVELGMHPAQIWTDWWDASRQDWEQRVRFSPQPLLARGLTRKDICDAIGTNTILRDPSKTLSREHARRAAEAHGLDPVDVWGDEWEWANP